MKVVRVLSAPKEGNTASQYEDAWAVAGESVVLCDGASSAVYAREWAQRLAEEFAGGAPFPESDDAFWERVAAQGRAWRAAVEGGSHAWYAAEKLPEGSAASLLAVTLAKGVWQARAVGDACCFLLRADRLKYAFPLTRSRQFGTHPALVPTDPSRLRRRPPVVRFSTPVEAGDRLLLMTDALACWLLSGYERREKPWNGIVQEEGAFAAWVTRQREAGALKNDDVTLIELEPG